MKIYHSGDLDFSDENDRKVILHNRRVEQKEYLEKKKLLNKSYLKGQRGVRLYYDTGKREYEDYDSYENNEDDYDFDDEEEFTRPVKDVFKKDYRREKLINYFLYLNGNKVLVRDLAWKFAVTERTIQNDLKFLESNGFIKRQINKTKKGKQTKSSYIVIKENLHNLPLKDNFVFCVITTLNNDTWYVLVKVKKDKTYSLPNAKVKRLSNMNIAADKVVSKVVLNSSFQNNGIVYECITQSKEENTFHTKFKSYFNLYIAENMFEVTANYKWVKTSYATRKIKEYNVNKGVRYIQNNVLGVK